MRERVAVLGGGPAAIAAAFELTSTPELRDRYEVTIHQPGWRLGGKGASGRERAVADRILEHGLHIWFGFYDNAFGVMQQAYEELGRPPEAPLATWEAAFKPCHDIVIYEHWKGRWVARRCYFPPNPLPPGGPALIPEIEDVLEKALEWLIGKGPAHEALKLAEKLLRDAEEVTDVVLKELGRLLGWARDELWKHDVADHVDDDELRFWFQNLDIVAATVRGIGEDRLLERGCESIDDEEFSAWLGRHGATAMTLRYSPVIRGVYDSSFAYEGGDKAKPNMAAGTALRDAIRTLFGHRGAFFYKMQAGMGDTVFGPFYEVLHRRGVKFRFFSFVTEVRPDAGGAVVDAIDVVDQAALTGDEYRPLYDVLGLPCWPSEPLWEQLVDGHEIAQRKPDFEHVADPLGRGTTTLRRGEHFDQVVLAFPPDVQRTVCGPLLAAAPRWAEALAVTKTVVTQAFQLWFTETLHEGLGWKYADDSICGSYVEPLDTWCSMSQLIGREAYPADLVAAMVYCCGVMSDAHLHDPAQADARARANTRRFVSRDATTLFPGAATPSGAFDWNVLVDLENREGEARLQAQYSRANLQAAERYVLSVAGSIGARLWPHQRQFGNLVLAGDWTRSGLDAGCIEGSVTSGILAARELSGGSRDITGVGGWLNADPERAA